MPRRQQHHSRSESLKDEFRRPLNDGRDAWRRGRRWGTANSRRHGGPPRVTHLTSGTTTRKKFTVNLAQKSKVKCPHPLKIIAEKSTIFKPSIFIFPFLCGFSYFNEICRRYSRLFDKLTFMENRELFFDMNAYMTNLNFTLQSCNRFLKWVGVERCMNSICGGPTLSGLPGGVAGK